MTLFTGYTTIIWDLRGSWWKMTQHYSVNVFGFMFGVLQTGTPVGVGAF